MLRTVLLKKELTEKGYAQPDIGLAEGLMDI